MNALDALAFFRDPRSVPALLQRLRTASTTGRSTPRRSHVYAGNVVSAVTGFRGRVATGAAIAEPQVTHVLEGNMLDAAVLGVSSGRGVRMEERRRIASILSSIAGVDYGDDYLLWKGWWEGNRERLLRR